MILELSSNDHMNFVQVLAIATEEPKPLLYIHMSVEAHGPLVFAFCSSCCIAQLDK